MRRLSFALSLSVIATLFALFGQGCSAQGEGQRCNVGNNNDDCAEGLVCKSSRELGGSADICCPETGTSDAAECIPGGTTTGTGGSGAGNTGGAGTGAGNTGGAGTGAGNTGGAGTGGASAGGGGATGTGGTGGTGGAGGA